jgi:hypothetical protein
MRQRVVLARGWPLLLGRLEFRGERSPGELPRHGLALQVVARCPYCGGEHRHDWPDPPFADDHAEHRASACWAVGRELPAGRGGYWVGLDPAAAAHNCGAVARFADLLAAWREGQAPCAVWTADDEALIARLIEADQGLTTRQVLRDPWPMCPGCAWCRRAGPAPEPPALSPLPAAAEP